MELDIDLKTLIYISTVKVLTHDDHNVDALEKEHLNKVAGYLGLAVPEVQVLNKMYLNKNMSFLQSKLYGFQENEKLVVLHLLLESIISDKVLESGEKKYLEKFLKLSDMDFADARFWADKIKLLTPKEKSLDQIRPQNQITAILCLIEVIFADSEVDEEEVDRFEKVFESFNKKALSQRDRVTGVCIYVELLLSDPNMANLPKRFRQVLANFLIKENESFKVTSLISMILELVVFRKLPLKQLKDGLKSVCESFQLEKGEVEALEKLLDHFRSLSADTYQKAALLNALEIHINVKSANPVNLSYLKNYIEKYDANCLDEKEKLSLLYLVVEAAVLDGEIRFSETEMINDMVETLGLSAQAKKELEAYISEK